MRGHSDGGPPLTAAAPVVLVAEQGQVAVEPGVTVASAIPGAPAPGSPPAGAARAPSASSARAAVGSHRAAAAATKARGSGDAAGALRSEGFSTTFARRESDIRRCFVQHPSDAASVTEISLRFDVSRDGRVAAVTVLPPKVGDAPLGACLAAVGKSTVFARQAAPVTFRIPVTVQIDAASKSRR